MGLYWKNIEKEVRYYNCAAGVISIEIYQLFNKIFGVSVGNEVKGCRCVAHIMTVSVMSRLYLEEALPGKS